MKIWSSRGLRFFHFALFVSVFGLFVPALARAQTVNFPDPNLEAAIREVLRIPLPVPVTAADMATLRDFDATARGIGDTTGLDFAVNLTNLIFSGNLVTNLNGFSGLTSLRRLEMNYAGVSSLNFLAGAQQLEFLQIYSNQIKDLSPLGGLFRLTYLQLDWNPVTNHLAIASLTNLDTLYLSGIGVSNLNFITTLPRLTHLGLYDNQVKDLSPLTGRSNLISLGLGWNGVTNPAVLATLTGLQELWLNGNSLTNVPYLAGLTNLTSLGLDYTALADLSPVTNLTRLQLLNVGENQLTSLPDLSALTNLSAFMMAGNQIADLSPLANLSSVQNLHLQRNLFQDVSPVTNCPAIYSLLLSGNSITNLPVLSALTNLQTLQLQTMNLSNLTVLGLETLPDLRDLDLYENRITDLSPLTNYPSVMWLNAGLNRLQRIEPLLDMPTLWQVNLANNVLVTNATSSAWNVITNLLDRGVGVEYDPQQPPPVPIQVVAQSASRSAFAGDNVQFSVSTAGGSPWIAGYAWEKDGIDLINDVRIAGADSDTLTIGSVEPGDTGWYRVRIWDDWMVTNSVAVQLLVVTNVAFADPNLEQAVRDRLGIPTGSLAVTDFVDLTDLDASYRGITNLAGLEAAANLVGLNLSGNFRIADFSPLTYLAGLNAIAVNDCGLDDVAWLSSLSAVTAVEIHGNFIRDLTPLSQLPGLVFLEVSQNYLTQIDPLAGLTNLAEVNLEFNILNTNAPAAAWTVIAMLLDRGAVVDYDPQNPVFHPPVIVAQPRHVAAYIGDHVEIHVEVGGITYGLNYRWQKNGINLEDTLHTYNTGDDTLVVENLQVEDAGTYRLRIWDEFGVVYSLPIALRVITNVAFVDPQLERAVRDQLGIPTAPLQLADVARLTWLDAHNYGLTNLAGIECCANLDGVSMSYNPGISDFTPLTQLPRLNFLDLNACGGNSIAFAAALPPLAELHLWNWNLSDLSPLLDQTTLRRLNLAYSADITNFPVLNALTNLESLWMEGTRITELPFAAFLPNLREFSFEDSYVSDLAPLAGATNLVWLDMARNWVTNAGPLANCKNLEWLSAGENQINDLTFAAGLTKLTFLTLYNNALAAVSPLAGLTNLTHLDISWNQTLDLMPVASLTRLTDFHAAHIGLSNNLGFLATLTNLQVLGLGNNSIAALPAYPHLNQIRWLNLENNPLMNISFASGMTNLAGLFISNTGVRDLSPLAGHTNLVDLGLAGNGITELSPLATLPYLRWVTLWDNHVQVLRVLEWVNFDEGSDFQPV